MTLSRSRFVPFLTAVLLVLPAGRALAHESAPAATAEAQVASDPALSAQDHLARAASYDARIQELDGWIAEHEQMKRDYRRFHQVNPKGAPKRPIAEMDRHCDAIIQDTRKLEQDLRDLAAWHRTMAAELQAK